MFIITLILTEKKSQAKDFMAAHNEWISKGFDDGLFLLVGSLKPQAGGSILAVAESRELIETRIAEDPFVREGIAKAHIQQVSPARTDARLSFLQESVS